MCPAHYHFIFLRLLIMMMSMTFVLSMTEMNRVLVCVMLSIRFSIWSVQVCPRCLFGECQDWSMHHMF